MAESLRLTASESLTIVEATPEALVVEASYGPGGKPPPKHLHPSQDEHFRMLEGTLRFRLGSVEHDLEPGDEIDVPAKVAHQVWNPHEEPARVRWTTAPAGRTEEWFRAVDALNRRAGEGKTPNALDFAGLLSEYRDCFRLAIGPDPLVGPAIAALGAVGRLRGHLT
ncbi:MAG: cupin domain-containing protein [Vicinamibacteria bacterium]|jgi:mannose-6-phosphate isomerase-like protein (cupin superfamily)